MASRRIERLNEQLRREISVRLRTELRDPRLEPVTVTAVRTAPDLTFARVLIRIAGDEAIRSEAMAGLEAAAPRLRRDLGKTLHVRRIPELDFRIDSSMEHAARIEELLEQVRPADGWVDDEDDSDTEGESEA
jgi:ribosome-binding factor A